MPAAEDVNETGSSGAPLWSPARHADRRPALLLRNRITAALRAWFEARGFTEVETPALQVSPGNEAHLHAFETALRGPDGTRRPLFLHTSPEFACKKLLAAGERAIFTFARVFRDRERGALHAPEFTMLEWYRAGEPYEALMEDCAAIARLAGEAAGTSELRWRGRAARTDGAAEIVSVAEAFSRHAGIDLLITLTPEGAPLRDRLADAARGIGLRIADDDTWSDIFSRVLSDRVEPRLGDGRLTILKDYPICEAALARRSPQDPRLAERFELYACGVELANAFAELTDADEQRRRFSAEMDEKQRVYGERYPLDEDFLAALAHMPPASGAALGLDRLVMLAAGANRIDDVQWSPVAEAP